MTLSESAGEKSLDLWFLQPLLMAQEIVGKASSDVLYILHSLLHCCKSSVLGLPGVLANEVVTWPQGLRFSEQQPVTDQ